MNNKKGTITPNGVRLEEHEYATVLLLTEYGYNIELIPASTRQGDKTPDMLMDGVKWEMKSPHGNGKNTIKNIMQKASHQAENVVIDLRRLKQFPQEKYIEEAKQRFYAIKRLKKLKIAIKGNKLLDFEK